MTASATIRLLIDRCNATTGYNDTTLSAAVSRLIAGYNRGSSGEASECNCEVESSDLDSLLEEVLETNE